MKSILAKEALQRRMFFVMLHRLFLSKMTYSVISASNRSSEYSSRTRGFE